MPRLLAGIRDAREAIARHDAPRILTLGGDCAVSVVPFTELAARYGDDLAVVWIDSHPDIGTSHSPVPPATTPWRSPTSSVLVTSR